jgi:mannose-6-phosphate isomerase-like protein (cupin superfamily)
VAGETFDALELAQRNDAFRRVIATGADSQLVAMRLQEGEEIGEEVHERGDQIVVVVAGEAEAVLDGASTRLGPNGIAFIPAGTTHNVIQAGAGDLRLLSIYAPPEHEPGTVHVTKAEADAAEHDH